MPRRVRGPFVGALAPGASRTHRIFPDLYGYEKPVVAGRSGAFRIDIPGPCQITVTNVSNAEALYGLFVVPSIVAGAAVFPWGEFFRELGRPGGPEHALYALLGRLRNQILGLPE